MSDESPREFWVDQALFEPRGYAIQRRVWASDFKREGTVRVVEYSVFAEAIAQAEIWEARNKDLQARFSKFDELKIELELAPKCAESADEGMHFYRSEWENACERSESAKESQMDQNIEVDWDKWAKQERPRLPYLAIFGVVVVALTLGFLIDRAIISTTLGLAAAYEAGVQVTSQLDQEKAKVKILEEKLNTLAKDITDHISK